MEKRMKLKIISAAAIIAVTAAAVFAVSERYDSGTAAFLRDSDAAENPLAAGEAVIEIAETFPPAEIPPGPGDSIVKVVRILNTGNVDCYVRALLLFEDSALEELFEPPEICSGWTDGGDGYYYYSGPVSPGAETEPLITGLRIRDSRSDGTEITAEDLKAAESGLIVYAEAIGADDAVTAEGGNCPELWTEFSP